MQKLNMADGYSLMIEPNGDNLRMVLVNNGNELACHKIKPKQLQDFISAQDAQLFRGRLQLHNNYGAISVKLKGEQIGMLDTKQISALMKTVLID